MYCRITTIIISVFVIVFFSTTNHVKANDSITHIIVTGYDKRDSTSADAMLSVLSSIPTLQNKAKKVHYSENIFAEYPNAKVLLFSFIGMQWISEKTVGDSIKDIFTQGLESGKHFFVYGDTYMQAMSAVGDNFFETKFGVKILFSDLQYKTEYIENEGYRILPFNVQGIQNDIIGKDISVHANTGNDTVPSIISSRYTNTVGSIIISGKNTIPFLYYDNETQNIAGARYSGETSRAVFLGFKVESLDSESEQKVLTEKINEWLNAEISGTEDEYTNPNTLTITPNPCSDYIEIRNEVMNGTFTIYDIQGNTVYTTHTTANELQRIDISHLSNGIYRIYINNQINNTFIVLR